MTDRLRGVVQAGQPDVPVAVPIDEARPVAEAARAAGFATTADERVVITRQVTEAEQERRQRMEETAAALSEAVAIVRDLAEFDPAPRANAYYCSMCGEETADDISLHTDTCAYARAVMWVAAHPAPAEETTSE